MKFKAVKRILALSAASVTVLSSALSCIIFCGAAVKVSAAGNPMAVSGTYPETTELYSGVNYSYYSLSGDSKYGAKDFSVVEFDLAQRDLYLDIEMGRAICR